MYQAQPINLTMLGTMFGSSPVRICTPVVMNMDRTTDFWSRSCLVDLAFVHSARYLSPVAFRDLVDAHNLTTSEEGTSATQDESCDCSLAILAFLDVDLDCNCAFASHFKALLDGEYMMLVLVIKLDLLRLCRQILLPFGGLQ